MKHVAVMSGAVAAALNAGAGMAAAAPNPVEAGLKTGYSGPQLTQELNHGVEYSVIQDIRDLRMTECGDVVTARYLLDSGVGGVGLMTVDITETFVIPDGNIHTIDPVV
ncbi:hypothetical protein [Nocardia nova]|nr:hypothetical protein [Nocardia nova]